MTYIKEPKRSPLHAVHQALDARMIAFAGWEMPVWYSSILDEHRAVRTAAGLFDVSHMGEILIEGKGALDAVQHLMTNDANRLAAGRVQYTAMCNGNGGIIDDLTVYRFRGERFMLVVNASNIAKDYAWIKRHVKGDAVVSNISDTAALLAVQGPASEAILQKLTPEDLSQLRYYGCCETSVDECSAWVSRSGYTGEDGFEIYCYWQNAQRIWNALLKTGEPLGITPCGLGARDTLRMEAGMMLYGNDIDEVHSPLQAGLAWTVKFDKPQSFIGKRALLREQKKGIPRRLVGFEVLGRGIARQHHSILSQTTEEIGEVTSGAPSPTLGKNIGMGYVLAEYAVADTPLFVSIRNERVPARVVPLPFYKRSKKGTAP